MGVPRLFKWLCERFPNAVQEFNKNVKSPVKTVDNLFIDANAIIHECTQRIHNYGNFRRLLDPNKNLSYQYIF